MKNIFLALPICMFLIIGFVVPLQVGAIEYTPLAPIDIPGEEDTPQDLAGYLETLFNAGIIIASILAILMIIYGGLTYMSTDAISGKTEGRERIQSAVGGLLLAIFAWLILNTINPDLLSLNLEVERADTSRLLGLTTYDEEQASLLQATLNNLQEVTKDNYTEYFNTLIGLAEQKELEAASLSEFQIDERNRLLGEAEALKKQAQIVKIVGNYKQKQFTLYGFIEDQLSPEGTLFDSNLHNAIDGFSNSAQKQFQELLALGGIDEAEYVRTTTRQFYTQWYKAIDDLEPEDPVPLPDWLNSQSPAYGGSGLHITDDGTGGGSGGVPPETVPDFPTDNIPQN